MDDTTKTHKILYYTPHLLFKMIGLIEAMALNPLKSRREYWKTYEDDPRVHLLPPMDFKGRFDISLSQFEHLWKQTRNDPPSITLQNMVNRMQLPGIFVKYYDTISFQ